MPDFSLNPQIPLSYNYGPSPLEQLSQVMSMSDIMQKTRAAQMANYQTQQGTQSAQAIREYLRMHPQNGFQAPTGTGEAQGGYPGYPGPATAPYQAPAPMGPPSSLMAQPSPTVVPNFTSKDTIPNALNTESGSSAEALGVAPAPTNPTGEQPEQTTTQQAQTPTQPPAATGMQVAPVSTIAGATPAGQQSQAPKAFDYASILSKINSKYDWIDKTYQGLLSSPATAYGAEAWRDNQMKMLDMESQFAERQAHGQYFYGRGTAQSGTGAMNEVKTRGMVFNQVGALFNNMYANKDPQAVKDAYAQGYYMMTGFNPELTAKMMKPEDVAAMDLTQPENMAMLHRSTDPIVSMGQGMAKKTNETPVDLFDTINKFKDQIHSDPTLMSMLQKAAVNGYTDQQVDQLLPAGFNKTAPGGRIALHEVMQEINPNYSPQNVAMATPLNQEKLENQARLQVSKVTNNIAFRTQDGKVNQAVHAFQAFQDKDGNPIHLNAITLPEIALSTAALVAGTNAPAIAEMEAMTPQDKMAALGVFFGNLTGKPTPATSQEWETMLKQIVVRQGVTAQALRDNLLDSGLQGLPTDLEKSRMDKIKESATRNNFSNMTDPDVDINGEYKKVKSSLQPVPKQSILSPDDRAAKTWLESHPDDPAAAGVRATLKSKGLL
jgi:hypothetical protein